MAIVDKIAEWDFVEGFRKARINSFSRRGLTALYEYLEQASDEMKKDIEYDPVSFAMDFTEYKNVNEYIDDYYSEEEKNQLFKEFSTEYGIKNNDSEEAKQKFNEYIKEKIEEQTALIMLGENIDDGFIINNY